MFYLFIISYVFLGFKIISKIAKSVSVKAQNKIANSKSLPPLPSSKALSNRQMLQCLRREPILPLQGAHRDGAMMERHGMPDRALDMVG